MSSRISRSTFYLKFRFVSDLGPRDLVQLPPCLAWGGSRGRQAWGLQPGCRFSLWLEPRATLDKAPRRPARLRLEPRRTCPHSAGKRQCPRILSMRAAGPSAVARVLPLDFSGVRRPRAPGPAACSLIQSVNKQSLRLPHGCPCMDWPLSKPVTGAASGPSGKAAGPQHNVPCSTILELGFPCPLEASLLILVACALASTICVQ